MKRKTQASPWRNAIVRYADEDPVSLLANPQNWRTHPEAQTAALSELGWIAPVIVNETTQHVVDGHARIGEAIARGEPTVPVAYVNLTAEQERLALASFDPIGALAGRDEAQLTALLEGLKSSDAGLAALLRDLAPVLPKPLHEDDANLTPPFTAESIIDSAMTYFRQAGFPYRKLPVHVCMQEINRLAATDAENLLHTITAYHVADTYHPHRFHAAADGMKSPVQAFEDDVLLRRAMRLALENATPLREVYWGKLDIVSGTQACANFRPGVAVHMYRQFCQPGATVLDTSAGYGGRLVGFMASGIAGRYIGIDPNLASHEGNRHLADDLGFGEAVELYALPVEDVSTDSLVERCDFAFTSPPYFAKEHYSDEPTQSYIRYKTGEEWRHGFLEPMLALQHAALKPGAHAVVNVADVTVRGRNYPLTDWTIAAARLAGFEYLRTDDLDLARRFGAGQDDEVATEPMLVFRKAVRERATVEAHA